MRRPQDKSAARSGSLPLLLALSCLLLAGVPGFAAEAQRTGGGEERAIRQVTERMWKALREQKLEAFQKVCSEDWRLFTAGGSEFSAERLFAIHRENIRDFDLAIDRFNVRRQGDTAWATYHATMSGERLGEPWGGDFLMTHIYERHDGEWICVHTHESKKSP